MKRLLAVVMTLLLAVTMFTACGTTESGSDEIDTTALGKIVGEYQVVGNEDEDNYIGSWWHLDILADDEEYGNYLSIYDNEAGNPGVEGEIVSLDDASIIVKIDPEYYDELPSSKWKDSGEYLEMTYSMNNGTMNLTNNDYTIKFIKED